MYCKLKKTSERLGINKGEIYKCERYWLDPRSKVSLLKRIPDGYEPHCNEYIHNVDLFSTLDDMKDDNNLD